MAALDHLRRSEERWSSGVSRTDCHHAGSDMWRGELLRRPREIRRRQTQLELGSRRHYNAMRGLLAYAATRGGGDTVPARSLSVVPGQYRFDGYHCGLRVGGLAGFWCFAHSVFLRTYLRF